jgi:hypothetical protein
MRQKQYKINEKKNIVLGKAGLTCKIYDMDMRYAKIACLSCVLNHETNIIW